MLIYAICTLTCIVVYVHMCTTTGDTHPKHTETMLRPTLDKNVPTNTTQTVKTYAVNVVRGNANLWKVCQPGIPVHGHYYHKKWFIPIKHHKYSHAITVRVTRQTGCNFKAVTGNFTRGLGKRLHEVVKQGLHYGKYMRDKCGNKHATDLRPKRVHCFKNRLVVGCMALGCVHASCTPHIHISHN